MNPGFSAKGNRECAGNGKRCRSEACRIRTLVPGESSNSQQEPAIVSKGTPEEVKSMSEPIVPERFRNSRTSAGQGGRQLS